MRVCIAQASRAERPFERTLALGIDREYAAHTPPPALTR
jgi:hypothetical protein